MRVDRSLLIALGLLGWFARPADACQCGELDEAAAIAASSVVFDGWVIDAPDPWHCAVPPAPRPRAGCARIAMVDAATCEVGGELMGLQASDGTAIGHTSFDADATTFCNVKPGKYVLTAREIWGGTEDGTVNFGRTLEIAPGGSYVVFYSAYPGQKLRVGVFRTIKGAARREVTVETKKECGTGLHTVGAAMRFFGHERDDGTIVVGGCASARALSDAERAESVTAPPPIAAAPAPATPPAAPSARRSGGCSTAPEPVGIGLAAWLAVFGRRRRRTSRVD